MSKIQQRPAPAARIEPLESRRLLAATLDPAFGTGGLVITDILPAEPGPDEAVAVVPMPDGRIFTVGSTLLHEISSFPDYRGVVTRYHANGIVDTTFGPGGSVILDLGNSFVPRDAERLADGSLLVLGRRGHVTHQRFEDNGVVFFEEVEVHEFILVRITPGGVIEPNNLIVPSAVELDFRSEMLRQPDGKILVTATDERDPDLWDDDRAVVIRLNANGTLDTGFGDDGVALAPAALNSENVRAVVLRDNGKIILGLYAADELAQLAQLDVDGSVDASFGGGDGVIDLDHLTWTFRQVAAAPGGGVFATAWVGDEPHPVSLVKLTSAGAIDPNFTISSLPSDAFVGSLLVQDDGKILVAGSTEDLVDTAERRDPIFVRFNPNGTLDTTFGTGGSLRVITDRENNSSIHSIAPAAAGAFYSAGTADGRFLTLRIADNPGPPAAGVAVTLIGETLHVIGTTGDDAILIRRVGDDIEVSAGAVLENVPLVSVKRLAVIADDGNDYVDARDLPMITTAGVDFPVTIDGGGGRDVLVGSQGRDRITGGNDNDKVHGWDGDDWLSGNAQKDRLDGGIGNDSVSGNGGRDHLGGSEGRDALYGGDQPDVLDGGAGDDSLEGQGGHDHLTGGVGKDTMIGGGGNDTFFARDGEADKIVGGLVGNDRAQVDDEDDAVAIEEFF